MCKCGNSHNGFTVTFTKTHRNGTLAGLPIPGQRVSFPDVESAIQWIVSAWHNRAISDIQVIGFGAKNVASESMARIRLLNSTGNLTEKESV